MLSGEECYHATLLVIDARLMMIAMLCYAATLAYALLMPPAAAAYALLLMFDAVIRYY